MFSGCETGSQGEDGVSDLSLWREAFGLDKTTVISSVAWDEDRDAFVASVRPHKRWKSCCGRCGVPSPGYDQGEGVRQWRTLDLGSTPAYLESAAPRVSCPDHGVTVAAVPWARHGSRQTSWFEDQVAWLAVHTSKRAVTMLMRIAWATIGMVIKRVVDESLVERDPFQGLTRIGIDEISFKRGHKYIMVVVDHDTGRLIWAAEGHDKKTLAKFFSLLGAERCRKLKLVSADAAPWIGELVRYRCKNATLCIDPFHVVKWATEALDEVRRAVWNEARKSGQKALGRELQGTRYALWKNPEDLTERQEAKLAWVQKTNAPLFRAYLLKEQLRQVFVLRGKHGQQLLDAWISWATRCRLTPFVKLAKSIKANRDGINAALRHGLSNAIVESTNTKLRLLMRIAYGFRNTDNLIALMLLDRGGHCPPLPRRPLLESQLRPLG
jgi:transposase